MELKVNASPALVRQQVVERLRNAIIECHFEPGGKLVERELCEMMGVSRTSLREALRQLEAEGLISIIPHQGPQVAVLDREGVRQIYEIRAALEALVVRLFVQKATENQIKALKRSFEKMRGNAKSKNWTPFRNAQTKMYEILGNGANNEILSHKLMLLRARSSLVRGMLPVSRVDESIEEVGRLIAFIEKRDEEGAEKSCIEHIEKSAVAAMSIVESENTPHAPVRMA